MTTRRLRKSSCKNWPKSNRKPENSKKSKKPKRKRMARKARRKRKTKRRRRKIISNRSPTLVMVDKPISTYGIKL